MLKNYLDRLTPSEFHTFLVGGHSTVAGFVFGLFILFGVSESFTFLNLIKDRTGRTKMDMVMVHSKKQSNNYWLLSSCNWKREKVFLTILFKT